MSDETPAKKPRAKRATDKSVTRKPRVKKDKAAATKPRAPRTAAVESTGKSTDALRQKAPTYVHDKEKRTAGGHVSVHNGDEIANKLIGKDLDQVYTMAARTLKEDEAELRKKYKHLNIGMQRMNLGNRMRAAAAK